MTFEYRDAVREDTRLLIGLAGGTGSGKTESAMRLATGIAGDRQFAVIDTENGRALHKADDYSFAHGNLEAPFTPERYLGAVERLDRDGFPVIVIDSFSHEWEGDGGILDIQSDELERMGGGDNVRMASWIAPKRRHKRLVSKLLQVRAHLIVCLRAEDKIEITKDERGKTVVIPKPSLTGADGWIPICERRFPFELTLSLLLTAAAPGIPKPIKLEARHWMLVATDRVLDEGTGRALAEWASGSATTRQEARSGPSVDELTGRLRELAGRLGALDAVDSGIAEHAGDVAWLERQIVIAERKLASSGPAGSDRADESASPAPPSSGRPDPETQTAFVIPASARTQHDDRG